MRDNAKSRAELLQEVETLRKRVTELEQCKDVTGRKKDEEEIWASEERFRELAARSFDLIFMTDAQGYLTYISAASEKIFHYKPEEMVGTHFKNYLITSEIPRVSQRFAENMKGENLGILRMEAMKKDGSHVFIELNSSPIVKNGETIGIQGIIRDITERKRAEDVLLESETRFREIFENTAVGMYRTTPDGQILMANPALVQMLGYSSFEELSQRSLEEEGFEPQYERSTFKEEIEREGRIVSSESTWITRDGKKLHVIENARAVRDEDGKTLYYEGTAENTTERKKAEETLIEAKEQTTKVLEGMLEAVTITDLNGKIRNVNAEFERGSGWKREEVVGKTVIELGIASPEEGQRIEKEIKPKLMSEGFIRNIEMTVIRKDGTRFPVLMSWTLMKDATGRPTDITIVATDITERKQAEETLRESEEKWRSLVENAPDVILTINPAGTILFLNRTVPPFTPGKAVGTSVYDYIPHEYHEAMKKALERVVQTGEPYSYELAGAGPDGRTSWYQSRLGPIKQAGKVVALILIAVDMTEHKKAEEKLKQYKFMVESAHDVIFFKDLKSRYIIANNKTLEAFGLSREQVIGKSDYEIMPDKAEAAKNIEDDKLVFETGKPTEITKHMTGSDGKERWFQAIKVPQFDDKGNIIGLIGIARDITESKRRETELNLYREKMSHAERLASLGTLSATLAHELNQPLTAIRLSIENSLADLETTSSPDTVIEDLKDGLSAVSDVASKVDSLRNFAQESSKEIISEVNLKAVAERILNLLNESARRARVSLHLKGMDKLPLIQSNEKDLEQLFFALVENAIQAADGKKECQLIISGDVKDEHIELRFSDTCGGIAPENLDRIFEPFFTTRPVGERTGLGLCIVERIVSGAGGEIRVESKAGKGSTFFVTLPISRGRMS